MTHYLLSTFSDAEEAPPADPPSPEQMQEMMSTIIALEAEMDANGTFVFGGHLHGPDAATVVDGTGVDSTSGAALMTDGPFVESKEHIAGFYIIESADLDEATGWAQRVSACVGRPIEVRPFGGTGRVADQMPPAE